MCDVMTEIVSLSVREVTLFLAVLAPPPLTAPAALLVTHFTSSQSCYCTGQSARIITWEAVRLRLGLNTSNIAGVVAMPSGYSIE